MSDYDAVFASVSGGKKKEPDEYDVVMQSIMPTAQQSNQTVATKLPEKTAPEKSLNDKFLQGAGNIGAGLVRGAGSIGATLLTPVDAAVRAMGVQNSFIGRTDRRQAMDDAFQSMGVQSDGLGYGAGKLAGEVAGTAGVGGGLANAIGRIPGAAAALPSLLPALASGGMNVAGLVGKSGLAARAIGGGVSGAASAGLVNPDDAVVGGLLGGALPVVAKGAGMAGQRIGEAFKPAPVNALKQATATAAIDAGYSIPPNMLNPSFKNATIESFSGKQATQQLFSTKNAQVTDSLIKDALGISPDATISKVALNDIRKTAGKTYAQISSLSDNAAADLEALKQARNDSQGWFKAYNRSESPNDLAQAKQYKSVADGLETSLETHALDAGRPELLPQLKDARTKIAKTYSVERALNDSSGTIDSRVLGRMYEKGVFGKGPSDGISTAARFASAFPTINKSAEQIGSPGAHNLKAIAATAFGGGGLAALGPVGALAALAPFVTPPIARSMMLRRGVQQSLARPTQGLLSSGIDDELLNQLLYRATPIAGAGLLN